MHIEAKRLAEHVYGYCDLDPHSRLAEKVNDLEAGELVSLFHAYPVNADTHYI
jgi:hypothetical protein